MSNWCDALHVRNYFAGLNLADLDIDMELRLVGPDRLVWRGLPVEELYDLRNYWLEARHGTFMQAEAEGRFVEYMAAYNAQPTVQDVLNERFGDPAQFGLNRTMARDWWKARRNASVMGVAA